MILEALFLATVLGGEKLSEISARNYVEKCKNDEELQRQRFFEDQKRHRYDNFAFFTNILNYNGIKFWKC